MDLYNQLRSRTFEEMYFTSEFIKAAPEMIKNTLEGNKVNTLPRVLLFDSHFPGLGKTSCARIIASELNPGIDDIEREKIFRGKENIVCIEANVATESKPIEHVRELLRDMFMMEESLYDHNYVFILNEVQKLTHVAQEPLLKLEDLPSNVYVIMTTTNKSSLRTDLLSRCEEYSFHPLSKIHFISMINNAINYLDNEKYVIDNDMLATIYSLSNGCPRKGLIFLSKYLKTGVVTEPDLEDNSETEEILSYFGTLVDMIEDTIYGKVTWEQTAIKLHRKPSSLSPDKFREIMIREVRSRIMKTGMPADKTKRYGKNMVISSMVLYSTLLERMVSPINYPPYDDLISKIFITIKESKLFLLDMERAS